MTLAIPRRDIRAVLISGEWLRCVTGSFSIDAYEFIYEPTDVHMNDFQSFGGKSGVTSHGFSFQLDDPRSSTVEVIAGPVTAIQAVRYVDWEVTRGNERAEAARYTKKEAV